MNLVDLCLVNYDSKFGEEKSADNKSRKKTVNRHTKWTVYDSGKDFHDANGLRSQIYNLFFSRFTAFEYSNLLWCRNTSDGSISSAISCPFLHSNRALFTFSRLYRVTTFLCMPIVFCNWCFVDHKSLWINQKWDAASSACSSYMEAILVFQCLTPMRVFINCLLQCSRLFNGFRDKEVL